MDLKKPLFFLLALLVYGLAIAQNTVSPYSIFGPGEMVSKGFGRSIGMGRSGIAIASDNRLNNLNPASYAGIGKQHFILEIGVDGKLSALDSRNNRLSGFNANMRYLALGLHIADWWATSVGISPYSTVGYSISTRNHLEGSSDTYNTTFIGSGGITLAYWSNAVRILKNLSLGINTSFLFGPLSQEEKIQLSNIGTGYTITHDDYLHSFYFDWGAQYQFRIKNWNYSLGAIYATRQSLRSTFSTTVQDANFNIINADEGKNSTMKIPSNLGFGVAVSKPGRFTFAADYQIQKWAGLKYPTMPGNFSDARSFSAGIELRPWKESISNHFFQNCSYRIGGNYNLSYLTFGSNQITGFGLNLGIGMPFRNQESTINLAMEAGKTGTTRNYLVEENFLLFHLNISINELWFIKKKFY